VVGRFKTEGNGMGARLFQQIEKIVINEIVSGLAPEGDVRAFGNDFLQKLNEPFAGKGEVGIRKPEVVYSPGLQMFDFGNEPVGQWNETVPFYCWRGWCNRMCRAMCSPER
jgi:hypothetical protein